MGLGRRCIWRNIDIFLRFQFQCPGSTSSCLDCDCRGGNQWGLHRCSGERPWQPLCVPKHKRRNPAIPPGTCLAHRPPARRFTIHWATGSVWGGRRLYTGQITCTRLNSCTFIISGVQTILNRCKLLRPAWIWISAAVGSSQVLLIVLWVWNLHFYFQVWSVWGARISRRWTLSDILHSTDMDSKWTWVRATGIKRKWKCSDSGQPQRDFALKSLFSCPGQLNKWHCLSVCLSLGAN